MNLKLQVNHFEAISETDKKKSEIFQSYYQKNYNLHLIGNHNHSQSFHFNEYISI